MEYQHHLYILANIFVIITIYVTYKFNEKTIDTNLLSALLYFSIIFLKYQNPCQFR